MRKELRLRKREEEEKKMPETCLQEHRNRRK
jgi:hypothetical protein